MRERGYGVYEAPWQILSDAGGATFPEGVVGAKSRPSVSRRMKDCGFGGGLEVVEDGSPSVSKVGLGSGNCSSEMEGWTRSISTPLVTISCALAPG